MEHAQLRSQSVPWAFFRLAPFPQIAIRVMQMVNKEYESLDKISALIASDPAFASELLTVANSPLYAPRVPATSVLQAVSRLGMRNIQGLCLTVAVRAYLGDSVAHPIIQAVWHHNLATALIASDLAVAFSSHHLDKDMAYTAGVMHDIGRLAMTVLKPFEYEALLRTFSGTPESILEAEWSLFGFDHCQAGEQLIAGWHLPHHFDAVVAQHHNSVETQIPAHAWNMADVVRLACRVADAAGFAAFPGCTPQPYAELISELPEAERDRFYRELPELTSDIHAKISAVESC